VPKFSFSRVNEASVDVLRNLYELYCHDMSQWLDVETNKHASFSDHYDASKSWENGGSVFMAKNGSLLIGFAIVQSASEFSSAEEWDLKEFFVLRKYRRTGVGRAFANFVWNAIPGKWLVRVHSNNRPVVPFWQRTMESYSDGKCREELKLVNGNEWFYFTLDGKAR